MGGVSLCVCLCLCVCVCVCVCVFSGGDVKELEKAIVNLVKSENADIKQKQDLARLPINQCQLVIVHTYASSSVVKDAPLTQVDHTTPDSVF